MLPHISSESVAQAMRPSGLFELGLLLSRLMMWHHRRMTVKEEAAELKRMAAEELAAHHAHVPTTVHEEAVQPVSRSFSTASSQHFIDHQEGSLGESGDAVNDDPTTPRKDDDRD